MQVIAYLIVAFIIAKTTMWVLKAGEYKGNDAKLISIMIGIGWVIVLPILIVSGFAAGCIYLLDKLSKKIL